MHIRKAYGLGPMAMGGLSGPTALRLAWPTVEAGGMSLEGAAALIQRKQEPATDDGTAGTRRRRDELAAEMRERSLAENAARTYTFDEVIDPAETRERIIRMLRLLPPPPARAAKKHYIDTW